MLENGYEDVKYLTDYDYHTAIIGVSSNNRVIYDFEKMVDYLVDEHSFTYEEAVEWIEYNTIRALSYFGSDAPIVMYPLVN